jgi:hypothetical protein
VGSLAGGPQPQVSTPHFTYQTLPRPCHGGPFRPAVSLLLPIPTLHPRPSWRTNTAHLPNGAATIRLCAARPRCCTEGATDQWYIQEEAVQEPQWYVFHAAFLHTADVSLPSERP